MKLVVGKLHMDDADYKVGQYLVQGHVAMWPAGKKQQFLNNPITNSATFESLVGQKL